MKNNLTPEEEKLMLEVQDEWINRFNSLPRIDKEKLEKGINWLYELCGFNKPTIINGKHVQIVQSSSTNITTKED